MLLYPKINPIALSIGPLDIHWYGIMYILSFFAAWLLAKVRIKRNNNFAMSKDELSDLIFYLALGVILGGRVGYILFYGWQQVAIDPWFIFKIWQGGMSFHGGLLGVIIAIFVYSKKIKWTFWKMGDFVAPLVPLGLAFGRLGNFINGELWGRPTLMPWGMITPQNPDLAVHPSQLYELMLEGIVLFFIVWFYAKKPRKEGQVSAVFLIGYAISRFIVEFFRQPDFHIGFVAFNWLTMGQVLSMPMLLLGIWLIWRAK